VLSNGCEHVQADFPADVTQSTLSYHMKRLRQTDVARSRPDGRLLQEVHGSWPLRLPWERRSQVGQPAAYPGRDGLGQRRGRLR
jgi:DNA-binding transcriptional ArsR family regulator